jgi:hypothetical protein
MLAQTRTRTRVQYSFTEPIRAYAFLVAARAVWNKKIDIMSECAAGVQLKAVSSSSSDRLTARTLAATNELCKSAHEQGRVCSECSSN